MFLKRVVRINNKFILKCSFVKLPWDIGEKGVAVLQILQ